MDLYSSLLCTFNLLQFFNFFPHSWLLSSYLYLLSSIKQNGYFCTMFVSEDDYIDHASLCHFTAECKQTYICMLGVATYLESSVICFFFFFYSIVYYFIILSTSTLSSIKQNGYFSTMFVSEDDYINRASLCCFTTECNLLIFLCLEVQHIWNYCSISL